MPSPRVALLLVTLGACRWLSTEPAAVVTADGTPAQDPADRLPKCKPTDLKEERGAVPWTAGATSPGGWSVTEVDGSNTEFVRMTLSKDGQTGTVEIAYNEAAPGDWATKDYRLMPAPDTEPPQALLDEAMAMLRAAQDAQSGAPFVKRRRGIDDPYADLPPCGPDGKPI